MNSPAVKHALELALGPSTESENSELCSESGRVESILPHLHDSRVTSAEIVNEKPWHRTFAYMLLCGTKLSVCAQQFGVTVGHLSVLRKQPWFKRVIEELADLHFGGSVLGQLEGAAAESITVLTDLALGAKSETVRASAATQILNAFLKHREPKKVHTSDPKAELTQLEEELAMLKNETITGHRVST